MIDGSKILTKAILIDNEWIPIWDFTYKKNDDDYGFYFYKNESYQVIDFQNVFYDINTKTIYTGIKVNIYPENTIFYKGDVAYIEDGFQNKHLRKLK